MKIKLLISIFAFLCIVENIHSCPIWAGPHKRAQGAAPRVQPEEHESEQWPMAAWADPSVHQTRVRRRDQDLIPLDLEVFRRENLGPKPEWRDPHLRDDNSPLRKHIHSNSDEE